MTDSKNMMVGATSEDALWDVAVWVSIMIGDSSLSDLSASSDEASKQDFEELIDVNAKRLYDEHCAASPELGAMLAVISGHGHRQRIGTPVYKIHLSVMREGMRLAVNAYKECGTCPLRARIEMYRKLMSMPDVVEPSRAKSLSELAGVI